MLRKILGFIYTRYVFHHPELFWGYVVLCAAFIYPWNALMAGSYGQYRERAEADTDSGIAAQYAKKLVQLSCLSLIGIVPAGVEWLAFGTFFSFVGAGLLSGGIGIWGISSLLSVKHPLLHS